MPGAECSLSDHLATDPSIRNNALGEKANMPVIAFLMIGLLAWMVIGPGCSTVATGDPVSECTVRGIHYFREIGSFPTLSDGRDAANVAAERCRRTITAF